MAKREARRKDGIDAVAIVTPNHVHFPAAKAFLERGIHVICDKPMTTTLKDARKLRGAGREVGLRVRADPQLHRLSDGPAGARRWWPTGELGAIRVVQAEYAQDWLTTKLEDTGQKQADWRTDPARSGPAGCTGDIGTHAMNLAAFISGLELESLERRPRPFVPGRALDDNAQSCCASPAGRKGMLWASQVAPGNENALRLRVYGEKAGLDWAQEDPNYLRFTPYGQPPS